MGDLLLCFWKHINGTSLAFDIKSWHSFEKQQFKHYQLWTLVPKYLGHTVLCRTFKLLLIWQKSEPSWTWSVAASTRSSKWFILLLHIQGGHSSFFRNSIPQSGELGPKKNGRKKGLHLSWLLLLKMMKKASDNSGEWPFFGRFFFYSSLSIAIGHWSKSSLCRWWYWRRRAV